MSIYNLRPHHGLCIMFFEGKGYNEKFIKNMDKVVKSLDKFPDTEIILNSSNDIICSACPHKGTSCAEKSVLNIDAKILSICQLKNGEKIKFSEFKYLIHNNVIALLSLEHICTGCRWKTLCESKIKKPLL